MSVDLSVDVFSPYRHPDVDTERAVDLLCGLPPEVRPCFYNFHEPINKPLNCHELSSALAEITASEHGFYWRGKAKSLWGSVHLAFGAIQQHTCFSMFAGAGHAFDGSGGFVQFAEGFSVAFDAHFACVQLLAQGEVERGLPAGTVTLRDPRTMAYSFGINTFKLHEYLPDLYWLTVFGAPYVELFGRERLLSTPAYKVEQWRDDLICVQLTESLQDMVDAYDRFTAVREESKAHLGKDAFFDAALGPSHAYRVPDFNLPPADPPLTLDDLDEQWRTAFGKQDD